MFLILQISRGDELSLEWVLLTALMITVVICSTVWARSMYDLVRAVRRGVPGNPEVTAAAWGVFTQTARLLKLGGVGLLVFVRIEAPQLTAMVLFWVLLNQIALLCISTLADVVFRYTIEKQSEKLANPCGKCPHQTVVRTNTGDIHVRVERQPEALPRTEEDQPTHG